MALVIACSEPKASPIASPVASYSEHNSTNASPLAPYSEDVSTIASPLAPYSGRGVGGEGQSEAANTPASDLTTGELSDYVDLVPYSPWRPIFRDLAFAGAELEISGEVLQAIFVEMDLPELAITGPAIVHEIRNAPTVKPGAGRVITATFHHSSGDVIDLVVGESEPIGTTSNHPFWSVDRQEYVQAGQLAIGERLQTFSGDTKRVVSKLARPGPQPVYNLEVFAEHVYYVGEDGVLVHNAYNDFASEITALSPNASQGQMKYAASLLRNANWSGDAGDVARYRQYMSGTLGIAGQDLRRTTNAFAKAGHGNSTSSNAAQIGYYIEATQGLHSGTIMKVGIVEKSRGLLTRFNEQIDNVLALALRQLPGLQKSDLSIRQVHSIAAQPFARLQILSWESTRSTWLLQRGEALPGHLRPR